VKVGGLMDTIATLTSITPRHGVPLESMVRKFAHSRFEPAGFTGDPDVPLARSIADHVYRWLGIHYVASYCDENGFHGPQGNPGGSLGRKSHKFVAGLLGLLPVPLGPPALAGATAKRSMMEVFAAMQSDVPARTECAAITVQMPLTSPSAYTGSSESRAISDRIARLSLTSTEAGRKTAPAHTKYAASDGRPPAARLHCPSPKTAAVRSCGHSTTRATLPAGARSSSKATAKASPAKGRGMSTSGIRRHAGRSDDGGRRSSTRTQATTTLTPSSATTTSP
jgi:hypothetical protein